MVTGHTFPVCPELSGRVELISLSARLALAKAIGERSTALGHVKDAARPLKEELRERREKLLDQLRRRYGDSAVENTMMMQVTVLARAIARAVEVYVDGA